MAEEPTAGQFSDQFDALTREEIRILYCLHILELTPEETAARIWPGVGEWARKANEAYVRWVLANILEATASGELPPFPKAAFLSWSGLPADPVTRPH